MTLISAKERKKTFLLQPLGDFLFCVHPSLCTVPPRSRFYSDCCEKLCCNIFISPIAVNLKTPEHHLNTLSTNISKENNVHFYLCLCSNLCHLPVTWVKYFESSYMLLRQILDYVLIDKAEVFSAHSYIINYKGPNCTVWNLVLIIYIFVVVFYFT